MSHNLPPQWVLKTIRLEAAGEMAQELIVLLL